MPLRTLLTLNKVRGELWGRCQGRRGPESCQRWHLEVDFKALCFSACVCVRAHVTQQAPGFVIRVSTAPEVSQCDRRDQPDEQSPVRRLLQGPRAPQTLVRRNERLGRRRGKTEKREGGRREKKRGCGCVKASGRRQEGSAVRVGSASRKDWKGVGVAFFVLLMAVK